MPRTIEDVRREIVSSRLGRTPETNKRLLALLDVLEAAIAWSKSVDDTPRARITSHRTSIVLPVEAIERWEECERKIAAALAVLGVGDE